MRWGVFALAVLTALTGCGQSSAQRQMPLPTQQQTLAMPLNGLTAQAPSEQTRLEITQDELAAACMRRRSFRYQPAFPLLPADGATVDNYYGLIAMSTASRQGYGITDNAWINAQNEKLGATVAPGEQSAAFLNALTGTAASRQVIFLPGGGTIDFDANGCVTIAVDELYGKHWSSIYYTVAVITSQIVEDVENSTSWRDTVKAWSGCMKDTYGRAFMSPLDARAWISSLVSHAISGLQHANAVRQLKILRAAEVRLASEDARCQARVHLPDETSRAQARAQRGYQSRYAAILQAYQAEQDHALRFAATLVPTRDRSRPMLYGESHQQMLRIR